MKQLRLMQKRANYGVEMYGEGGESLGWFEYQSLEKAKKMYDVLNALSHAAGGAAAKGREPATI